MEQVKPKRKRIVAFDVIAIFSCLCVTIVHFNASISGYMDGILQYPNSLIPNFYFDGTVYLGSIGVSLFFILSGARNMYTYKDVKTFFSRRVATLYPMFWIAWAVALLGGFLIDKGISVARPYLLVFSLLGIDGYLASLGLLPFDYYRLGEWFLGCIICLYCVFPVLHWLVKKTPIGTLCLAIALYVGCALLGVQETLFPMRILEITLGMLFVHFEMNKHPKILLGIGLGSVVLAWVFRHQVNPLSVAIGLCIGLFALLTVVSQLITNEKVQRCLAWISGLTYPIFLVHHWLIDRMVQGFYLPEMPRMYVYFMFISYLALTTIVAFLLSKAGQRIQSPLFKLRRS